MALPICGIGVRLCAGKRSDIATKAGRIRDQFRRDGDGDAAG